LRCVGFRLALCILVPLLVIVLASCPNLTGGDSDEAVTGVSIDPAELTIRLGTTRQLTAVILPLDASNKAVSWSSSDETSATVGSNGIVTPIGTGTATITVSTSDGGFTAACEVTVIGAQPPKTGQTTSYAAGDDGALQKGTAWPDPRFVDNGNGTITDKLTGLMWEAEPDTGTYTWANAFDVRIAALNTNADSGSPLGGHTDWRLPNYRELLSLYNFGTDDLVTWLNGYGFTFPTGYSFWWSSTTAEYSGSGTGTQALTMRIMGYICENATKTSPYRVIGVRTAETGVSPLPRTGQTETYHAGDDGDLRMGVAWPDSRFVDNGNGTITDKLTGFIWEQNPGTDNYQGSWVDSIIQRIAALNTDAESGSPLGAYTDWRLPNVLELFTLYNPGSEYVANGNQNLSWLNTQGFGVDMDAGLKTYWTSTSFVSNPSTGAWVTNLNTGGAYEGGKTANTLKVIGVRGGQ